MAEPGPVDPAVELREDLEDLQAQVRKLTKQLTDLQQAAGPAPGADENTSDEPQFPPFIALLDQPEYGDELRALAEWVEGVLVTGYLGEATPEARWCHRWIEHETAVLHLHALWLAWQELTDPRTCGLLGPSIWHRDHYRPCMNELRSSRGPFAGCVKGENQVGHRLPGQVPSLWYGTESET